MDFRINGSRTPQVLMLCGALTLSLFSGNTVSKVEAAPAAVAPVDFKEIQVGALRTDPRTHYVQTLPIRILQTDLLSARSPF